MLSHTEEDGDCLGGLPYSFVYRIISFFPSTKHAFESNLYETLQHKWTEVPSLNFVDKEKFVIDSKDIPLVNLDRRLSLWIRFAARKDVKELILDCVCSNVKTGDEYLLPQFLFNNSSFRTL
ncbi:hypothetical protein M5689_005375 [Euphorbia peplus]|nr:hypothetical protein M5689_005375 [Euphorbia peplus]